MCEDINILKKKIYHRSKFRGTKELDIIIGNFAQHHIDDMSKGDLFLLEDFIKLDEALLADYLIYNHIVPKQYQQLVKKIKAEHQIAIAIK